MVHNIPPSENVVDTDGAWVRYVPPLKIIFDTHGAAHPLKRNVDTHGAAHLLKKVLILMGHGTAMSHPTKMLLILMGHGTRNPTHVFFLILMGRPTLWKKYFDTDGAWDRYVPPPKNVSDTDGAWVNMSHPLKKLVILMVHHTFVNFWQKFYFRIFEIFPSLEKKFKWKIFEVFLKTNFLRVLSYSDHFEPIKNFYIFVN